MIDLYIILVRLLSIYELLIFIWVIMGWLQAFGALPYSRPLHTFMNLLYQATEPVLGAVRRILPPLGSLDLSPLVVIVVIEILKHVLGRILL